MSNFDHKDELLEPFTNSLQKDAGNTIRPGKENQPTLWIPGPIQVEDAMCARHPGINSETEGRDSSVVTSIRKPSVTGSSNEAHLSKHIQTNMQDVNKHFGGFPKALNEEPGVHVSGVDKRKKIAPYVDMVTPKRKRKFPGPAGLLPKLAANQGMSVMSPSSLSSTTPQSSRSPLEEPVLQCSQTSEDLANDGPWQALVHDIGGDVFLKKFSISSTLLQAGKRQLHQGKATLIFGRIESIDGHGSEASITLRDQSGCMQGTVHKDLLKEHEADLHIGTVLILKQVSIISPSNRHHYLNITPNNVVSVYHTRQSSLERRHLHGSHDSLHSVLSALEKKALSERSSLNNSLTGTPLSHTGRSRLSTRISSTGTPQLFNATRGINTPQALNTSRGVNTPQLFNTTRGQSKPQALNAPRGGNTPHRFSTGRTTPSLNTPQSSLHSRPTTPALENRILDQRNCHTPVTDTHCSESVLNNSANMPNPQSNASNYKPGNSVNNAQNTIQYTQHQSNSKPLQGSVRSVTENKGVNNTSVLQGTVGIQDANNVDTTTACRRNNDNTRMANILNKLKPVNTTNKTGQPSARPVMNNLSDNGPDKNVQSARLGSHNQSSVQSVRLDSHNQSSVQSARLGAHNQSSVQSARLGSHNQSSVQSARLGAHNQSSVQSARLGAHNQSSVQSARLGSHNQSSVQSVRLDSHNQSSVQSVRLSSHNQSSVQLARLGAHNQSSVSSFRNNSNCVKDDITNIRISNTNLPIESSNSVKLQTTSTRILQNSTPSLPTPEKSHRSKWKFKSPPSRNMSTQNSPVLDMLNSHNKLKGNMQTSKADVSCEIGGLSRTPDVTKETTTLMSPIETSQWVFKATKCAPDDTARVKNTETDLWDDDLSDDLLSQLSEDML